MKVAVMRRDLTPEELDALKRTYPGESIEVVRVDPQNAAEHLAACERIQARVVFLPQEQPLPVLAVERGFKHLVLRGGKLLELVRVVPEFISHTP